MKNQIIGLLLLMVSVVGACKEEEENIIKIGLLSVFSGDGANYGETARTGVDLAVEEINASGGVNGKKIEIIYEDDKGDTKEAVSGFQKLVVSDKVPVVIGPFYSGQVLACAPEANRLKTVLISGSATSDNIKTSGKYIFRTCPTNAEQGKTIAQFCVNDLKKVKAYIIYRNADYGITLRDRFKEEYTQLGGNVVGETAIAEDANDARSQLNNAKQAKPDVIFIPVHYPEGAVILKQAREMGIETIFIGGDGGYDSQLITGSAGTAEGSYWSTIGWGETSTKSLIDSFVVNYKKKYGKEPGVYSGLYYDALKVVAYAISQLNVDSINGPSLQKMLVKTKDYKGPTGTITFTSDGDVEKPFAIYQVKLGKFTLIK